MQYSEFKPLSEDIEQFKICSYLLIYQRINETFSDTKSFIWRLLSPYNNKAFSFEAQLFCFFGSAWSSKSRITRITSLFVSLRTLLACWREIVLCQSVLRNYQREFSFESQKISYSCVTMLQPSNKMSHVNLYLVYVENKL